MLCIKVPLINIINDIINLINFINSLINFINVITFRMDRLRVTVIWQMYSNINEILNPFHWQMFSQSKNEVTKGS